SLHQVRDRQAFTLAWEIAGDVGEIPVPPMLLLPLADNAVKHGPAAGHAGVIVISTERREPCLLLTFENPGLYRGPRAGSDGLPTVEKRLAHAYDGRA